jgi:alpha-L-fucosidase
LSRCANSSRWRFAFDADAIAAFAADCGMRYINPTTRHHDSFCLFAIRQTPFQSSNTPAGRHLIAELAGACERHGLGFFLYYSHGRDWRHPRRPATGLHPAAQQRPLA